MASAAPANQRVAVSDLAETPADVAAPKLASRQILGREVEEGLQGLERPTIGLLLSGLSAGLDLGFSLFLMAVMLTNAQGVLPEPVVRLLVANMYAVGFIFVVLGRSELFTEQTTLAVLPVLSGRATVGALVRLWALVYVSNLAGAAVFAVITATVGPLIGVIEPHALGQIAHRLTDHSGTAIFLGGILAGWLMGLLSWLVAAGRDTISQIVLVWLITTAIGFAGLHHVILGAVEVLAGAFANQGIDATSIGRFLLCGTFGNIIGGTVFVALIKYGHARPEAQSDG
jgi:formate/nitrite transporter FocA (FNT family)